MVDPKIGDFIIASDEIYEITDRYNEGYGVYYNISLVDNPADSLDFSGEDNHLKRIIKLIGNYHLTLEQLKNIGHIVKKEEASKAIEILFKKS